MKNKIILLLVCILIFCVDAKAAITQDAIAFFNQYTNYANTYDDNLLNMYSPNVKIIRQVVKPSGDVENITVPTKRYFKELKLGKKAAKLKRYKNKYRNIIAQEIPNGIRITAERQPTNEKYWLKMYQILQNTDEGLKITEEMMQTKVQAFLKHKNKGG